MHPAGSFFTLLLAHLHPKGFKDYQGAKGRVQMLKNYKVLEVWQKQCEPSSKLNLDLRKKKKLINLPEDIEFPDENPGPDVLFDVHQKQAVLERFIHELPERQQLAVNLCFYEGLSNNEAAQIIGVKVKALQSLVMRAKTTLKHNVKQYLGGGSR